MNGHNLDAAADQANGPDIAALDPTQAAALAVLADHRQLTALAEARGIPEETMKAELEAIIAPESIPFDCLPTSLQDEYYRNGKAIGMVKRDLQVYLDRRNPKPISVDGTDKALLSGANSGRNNSK
jgi:hypothetical protein